MVVELIVFIVILSLLIVSHELGHFIAAKRSGMRVDEFGFGFPPRLFAIKKGETTYTVNLIPFGGFVKIYGEDSEGGFEEQDRDRRFTAKSKKLQALVLVAGVLANFLLAWVLFSIGFATGFPTTVTDENREHIHDPSVVITQIFPDSPADEAGIAIGDIITEIRHEGTSITVTRAEDVVDTIESLQTGPVELVLLRGGTEEVFPLVPEEGIIEGKRAVGISVDTVGILRMSVFEAVYEGALRTGEIVWFTIAGIGDLIHDAVIGKGELSEQVAGPIGIYTMVGQAQSLGIPYLIGFTALISVSLGVINLIPFPALDGGRLLFLIIESVKGTPINPRVVQTVNYIGFAILLILMVLVSYGDLARIGVL